MEEKVKKESKFVKRQRAAVEDIKEVLETHPNISPNAIADLAGQAWHSVKVRLDRLEAAGIVEKKTVFREYRYRMVTLEV